MLLIKQLSISLEHTNCYVSLNTRDFAAPFSGREIRLDYAIGLTLQCLLKSSDSFTFHYSILALYVLPVRIVCYAGY